MTNTELLGTFGVYLPSVAGHLVYMTKPETPGLFDDAEIIHSYSREQAIEDGVLVDVTPVAEQAGFKVPVALTDTLWARLEPSEADQQLGQSVQGRLWDVLNVLRYCAVNNESDTVYFKVDVAEAEKQTTLNLKSVIGPGDTPAPVVTIMFENED
jgi:hypothetical protein